MTRIIIYDTRQEKCRKGIVEVPIKSCSQIRIHTDAITLFDSFSLMSKTLDMLGNREIIQTITSRQLMCCGYGKTLPFMDILNMDRNLYLKIVCNSRDVLYKYYIDRVKAIIPICEDVTENILSFLCYDECMNPSFSISIEVREEIIPQAWSFLPSERDITTFDTLAICRTQEIDITLWQRRIIKRILIYASCVTDAIIYMDQNRRDLPIHKRGKNLYEIVFMPYLSCRYYEDIGIILRVAKGPVFVFSENYNSFVSFSRLKYPEY